MNRRYQHNSKDKLILCNQLSRLTLVSLANDGCTQSCVLCDDPRRKSPIGGFENILAQRNVGINCNSDGVKLMSSYCCRFTFMAAATALRDQQSEGHELSSVRTTVDGRSEHKTRALVENLCTLRHNP